ncbi:hypothetical protein E8E11_007221 [Didymella keratinophila]|nr:hypothetical protein E8E11_007221 [Didymella keratinophila]
MTLKRVGSVSYAIPDLIIDSRQNELVSNALADYCAKHNFLSLDYAKRLGLQIKAHKATNITIGSGQRIKTLGTTITRFSFRGEPTAYDLTFHVLPKCIRDVVLGKRFLKDTRTLRDKKNFASRVVEKFSLTASKHKLFFLGDSAPAFTGSINGMVGKALADCGSSVLVMDEDYALGLGLPIHRGPRTRLLFADGSKKYTTGVTKGVRWQFGREKDAKSHHLDFPTLKDAPAPVILSDTFLFRSQAYSKDKYHLVDDDGDDDVDILANENLEAVEDVDEYFCHITIDLTHYPQGHVDFSSIPNRRHAETCLCSQIWSRIAKMPQSEQEMARQAEKKRQEEWQRDMDLLE